MSRWFRFYDAALDDPKVQSLPASLFRVWVNLLCVASKNDGKISVESLEFCLRIDARTLRSSLEKLSAAGLLDKTEDGFEPHNWRERQYKSDTSTERTRKHKQARKREGNVPATVPGTVPDTETDTEQKTTLPREVDLDDLERDLRAAAGQSIDPTSPELLVMSDPLSWLDAGAELDLDILPAIRARAQRAAGGSIRTWGYFRQAVAEAKAKRMAGLPVVAAPQQPWAPQPVDHARVLQLAEQKFREQQERGAA